MHLCARVRVWAFSQMFLTPPSSEGNTRSCCSTPSCRICFFLYYIQCLLFCLGMRKSVHKYNYTDGNTIIGFCRYVIGLQYFKILKILNKNSPTTRKNIWQGSPKNTERARCGEKSERGMENKKMLRTMIWHPSSLAKQYLYLGYPSVNSDYLISTSDTNVFANS